MMVSTRPTWMRSKLSARRQALVDPLRRRTCSPAAELLRLAQVRPGEGAAEQLGHEAADMVADLVGLADHALGIAHRVRARAPWGSRRSRCTARRAPGVHTIVTSSPSVVGAHDLAVGAHPELAADVRGRQRVDGSVELEVVVGVDLALLPRRRIEALRPSEG